MDKMHESNGEMSSNSFVGPNNDLINYTNALNNADGLNDIDALNNVDNPVQSSIPTAIMPFWQGYNYPIEDLQPLHDLLSEWNLECIYQTLLDELIDLKIMALMNDNHVNDLLKNYPLGIKVLFSHNLKMWQKSKNILPASTIFPIITNKKAYQEKSEVNNINLGEILNGSTTGLMINEYYKTNHKFNDNIRTLLVDTVISYIITKQMSMSVRIANSVADQIVDIFPTEIKDTYFMKCEPNKNPKGKLYAKFYNSMRVLKSSGLVSSTSSLKKIDNTNSRKHNIHFEPEKDINYIVDQIKNDPNCKFPEIEQNWKATTKYRLNEIQKATSTSEIINNWNGFTLPLGYRLVDIDFRTLYPDCPDLINTFEDKSKKIMILIDEKIKDSSSRKLLDSLKDTPEISQNGMYTVLLYLLHAIFVPTSKKVTRDHNGKINHIKHSIKDSQNSFIVFKNSVCEIEEYIAARSSEKCHIQPFILIVGTPINPKEIIVFFDCIKYKVFSILTAVDVCFKLIHLFNLEYPTESSFVWLFIQKYLYNLNTKFDKPCHILGQIVSDLSKL